ncbi:hypothetical protein TNCV_3476821 [Trichonephila clavipes]|nr:hypothetical protein TNCV_3476821 [Trichonephila clavipes]
MLLCYNAFAHRSILVNDFLVKTKTTVLPHPSYSPIPLTPCNFHLFPELACHFQGHWFQFSDEDKRASQVDLKVSEIKRVHSFPEFHPEGDLFERFRANKS